MGAGRAFFVTLLLIAVVFVALYHTTPDPLLQESTTGGANSTATGTDATDRTGGLTDPANAIATQGTAQTNGTAAGANASATSG